MTRETRERELKLTLTLHGDMQCGAARVAQFHKFKTRFNRSDGALSIALWLFCGEVRLDQVR